MIRNFVFVGSTGVGKSSTCNSIVWWSTNSRDKKEYFQTSDEATSCTLEITSYLLGRHKINVVDTPGFGDTRHREEMIQDILNRLVPKIVDPSSNTSGQIDCFCLVTKLTPRAMTLKKDIENLITIFGRSCLKSLVIVVIDQNNRPGEKLLEFFKKDAGEVIKMIEEVRGERFSPSWIVFWDNYGYRENQFENLLNFSRAVTPYSNKVFTEAQLSMKSIIDMRAQKALETRVEDFRKQCNKETSRLDEIERRTRQAMEEQKKESDNKIQILNIQNRILSSKIEASRREYTQTERALESERKKFKEKVESAERIREFESALLGLVVQLHQALHELEEELKRLERRKELERQSFISKLRHFLALEMEREKRERILRPNSNPDECKQFKKV